MNKTSLKTSLSICILVLFHLTGFGQVIKGTVRDKETQEPLRYATLSVIGQNQRVITHHDGTFTLDVSRARATDSVSVSYIGYQPANYALSDINVTTNQQFELQPLVYTIEPVVVTARERHTQDIGFTKRGFRRTGWGDFSSGRGRTRGVVIAGMDCSLPIKSFVFHIRDNEWDSVAFRLDLLPMKNGEPGNSLLTENVIIHTNAKNKWVSVDLSRCGITHCGDLLATLEWVDAWGETGEYSNVLTLSMGKGTGTVFTKEAGEFEGKLEEEQLPMAMYVEVFSNN